MLNITLFAHRLREERKQEIYIDKSADGNGPSLPKGGSGRKK